MSKIFLPSCNTKVKHANASNKLRKYLENREQVETVGCCKVFCKKANKEDTAVVICSNCAAIMEESSVVKNIKFVWEIIDEDLEFPFPNYHGERMAIQDCWRSYEKRNVQDAIRSLMKKMNIEVVELEENYERTKFCGADLLEPCTEAEKRFAPQRYVVDGASMYQPLSILEQQEYLQNHCRAIETEKVVCYCTSCLSGINQGGKEAIHLIELLFPENS